MVILPFQHYDQEINFATLDPQAIIEAIPVLYMCWLNHATFSCVGRLSDAPAVDRNTDRSRISGYQTLVRLSMMSLMTPSKNSSGKTKLSGNVTQGISISSTDSELDRALMKSTESINPKYQTEKTRP